MDFLFPNRNITKTRCMQDYGGIRKYRIKVIGLKNVGLCSFSN